MVAKQNVQIDYATWLNTHLYILWHVACNVISEPLYPWWHGQSLRTIISIIQHQLSALTWPGRDPQGEITHLVDGSILKAFHGLHNTAKKGIM